MTDISGNDWKPYINTGAHTDYPSASAILFSSFANTAKLVFNGDDTFGFSRTFAPGSSSVEPGLTPKTTVTIVAPTFTAYEADGGFARVLGGVHFREDVVESQRIGKLVAPYAYALAQQLIRGTPAFTSAPSPVPTAIPTAGSTTVPSNGFRSQCGGLNFVSLLPCMTLHANKAITYKVSLMIHYVYYVPTERIHLLSSGILLQVFQC